MPDYGDRYEQRREEQRQYANDVFYDIWRAGGDPDRIDYDRVRDHYWDGQSHESAARNELEAQRPKPPQQEEPEYPEEQYPEEPSKEVEG